MSLQAAPLRSSDSTAEISKERFRSEGSQTLAKLLKESREENRHLKERNNQLERHVDQLSKQLQKAGVKNPIFSAYMSAEEVPYMSKSFVEGIILENTNLKRQLTQPQKIEELAKQIWSLKSLIKSLKAENESYKEELQNVRTSGTASEKVILRLTEENKAYTKRYEQERHLKETLLEEIDILREQLSSTAKACIDIRNKLPNSSSCAEATLPSASTLNRDASGMYSSLEDLTARLRLNHGTDMTSASSIIPEQIVQKVIGENELLHKTLQQKEEELSKLYVQHNIMQHQLEMYKEDFSREQKDKEKALSVVAELEVQLRKKTSQAVQLPGTSRIDQTSGARTINQNLIHDSNHVLHSNSTAAEPDNISISSHTDVMRPKTKPHPTCNKCGKHTAKIP